MSGILAFAGSNSLNSINFRFLEFTIKKIHKDIEVIDLNNYDVPLYGIDLEKSNGIPENTKKLHKKIQDYKLLVIAVNEHNGGPSVFFKNHIDWLSRHDRHFLEGHKIWLLSTSPGRGGAQMAIDWASSVLPRFGGEIISKFSLASFNHSFSSEKGITDPKQQSTFDRALQEFTNQIKV